MFYNDADECRAALEGYRWDVFLIVPEGGEVLLGGIPFRGWYGRHLQNFCFVCKHKSYSISIMPICGMHELNDDYLFVLRSKYLFAIHQMRSNLRYDLAQYLAKPIIGWSA